ncbi:MAG: hypothetical protein KF841_02475 [Phycisphaerae bacterium]|nr:hypothetical protein [Phycisphaerae bacterium]
MGMRDRLDAVMGRRSQVEQELNDLRQTLDQTENSALHDLEAVLTHELEVIQAQINQINGYLHNVEQVAPNAG